MASRWTNMAQIGSCYPAHHHYPASTMEAQQAIAYVRASKGKCRVAGLGKSPNTSTFTNDHLIHMTRMNRILSIDTDARLVTCEPGALMEDVMNALDKVGLMMRCVPSYVQTTVGGCIATATHSSGITCRSLSDYVRAMTIVDGQGALRTLKSGKDDKELRLAACHLGVLGIVTEVTLEVQPRVQWRLDSRPLSMQDANNTALVEEKWRNNEYYRWWWVPHTEGCYESFGYPDPAATNIAAADPAARITPNEPQRKKDSGLGAQCPTPSQTAAAEETARRATAPSDSNKGKAGIVQNTSTVLSTLTSWVTNELVRHQLVEWSLWLACRYPSLQPHINTAYQQMFYTSPMVQRGSALQCFTFDCLFRQWANEWAIDATRAVEAFQRLHAMIEKENMLLHFPVEFRFSASDDSDMSPAVGRPTCWIGVVMYRPRGQEARDTRRVYDGFNAIMEDMEGRPHWAKYYNWGHREMSKAYGTHWDDFLELRRKMDPDSLFVNEWFGNLMSPDRNNSTEFKGH